MHTLEIYDTRKTLYLPETLAECNAEQYVDMCHLIYRYQMGYIDYETLRVLAFYQLLNLKRSKEGLKPEEDEKWSKVYQFSELIDSFFEPEAQGNNEVPARKIIRIDYAHNPVERYRPLRCWYYGPTDYFGNIKFGEYLDGLRVFNMYRVSPSDKLLAQLAAIFYRKKKTALWFRKSLPDYDGDVRRRYNPNTMQEREKALRYAPWGFLYGFYLLFGAFQKFISTAVVPWGDKEIDLSILFQEGDYYAEAVPGRGLDSVVSALAESGQLGDLNGVRQTPLWEVLFLMYDLKKQDLDRKLNEKRQTEKS